MPSATIILVADSVHEFDSLWQFGRGGLRQALAARTLQCTGHLIKTSSLCSLALGRA